VELFFDLLFVAVVHQLGRSAEEGRRDELTPSRGCCRWVNRGGVGLLTRRGTVRTGRRAVRTDVLAEVRL